jgi:PPOX class probable F420-dependent enzyme
MRGTSYFWSMTSEHVLPDPSTDFGQTVRRRLREETVIWLTTVGPTGTPQPNPVWFLWEEDAGDAWGDGSFLIYHDDSAKRQESLTLRPRVSLNFNSIGGGGITVFTGSVEIVKDRPLAHEVPAYAEKYAPLVAGHPSGKDIEAFMARYSIVSRIRPTRVRGV